MKNSLVLARRELHAVVNSPVAYAVTVFFLLSTSIPFFFLQRFFSANIASLRSYFALFPAAFILIVPSITMRSWAEERKTGTAELLLTLPFTEWELVLGKFLSTYAVMVSVILLSVPVPISLSALGHFDTGAIVAEYAGAALLAAAAVSFGQFASSFAKNQITAFILTATGLLGATIADQVPRWFDLPASIAGAVNTLSFSYHFESFARGVLDSRDLAFFVIVAAFFLFLTSRVLIFRRWS